MTGGFARTGAAILVAIGGWTFAPVCAAAGEPGAYEMLAVDGVPVFAEAHGFADLENDIPIGAQTVFRIASLTKQFTSVAVLVLVEGGRLSLDDTLARVLPDCPERWRAITIMQLLSHTSGITYDMSPIFARLKEDFTPRALIAPYAARDLDAPPGSKWQYSNVNYWILGLVIEHVTGQSYAAFVEERVLRPAHLRATRYGSASDIIAHRARGYTKGEDGRWANAPYFSATIGYAAGGFVSTPDDLARWYAALGAGKVISRAMIDIAATEARTTDGKGTGYGLGWYVEQRCGVRLLHHGGSSPGFAAYVFWQPDQRLYAGIFSNTDAGGEPKARTWELMRRRAKC